MTTASLMHPLLAGICVALVATRLTAADLPRQHLSLDTNWKFHLGDDWPNALDLASSGTGSGPASEHFSDSYWRTVNLPHDWAVELPFDWAADGSHGFKTLGRSYPSNSIAWYRRTFDLPENDSVKRIWLTFDGVMHDATVWVNGWLVRRHEGGYYPFREDITDVVHFGGENTVAVRVDATESEGWFYEGAGIYRHVWLDVTAPVAVAPDGIFVFSTFEHNIPSDHAAIHVEATLLNTLTNTAATTVKCEIISPDGKLQRQFSESGELKGQSRSVIKLKSKVSSPVLWSPESPKLYKLVTMVFAAGKMVDQMTTPFGIRTVDFDPNKGFLLNGKHYEIYGTCNHQDHAGVGAAIPDALQPFRIEKLKEFGCNAIRTSHNPPTPELLDACDRLGMLVLDESRLMGSDSAHMNKWDDQIRRDRNHPSVVIWCIANEQFMVQDTPQAGEVARTMEDFANKLDPTRRVTYASPEGDVFRGINSVIEVRGWNYHYGPDMDQYHSEHPNQPNVGTEQASVVSDRGIYANDEAGGYVTSYDVRRAGWDATAESWWSWFTVRPWLSGAFVWTGFDYRGEPTPYWWPCINSHYGILDTCGFPKDVFYYYKSWWTTNTVLHLFPHWNWRGKEGQDIPVWVYSNCKSVELFLNGKSLGKQTMSRYSHLEWNVNYEPGTLSAEGFDANDSLIAKTKEETTGEPAQIQLTPDRQRITADGEDVAVFTVSALDAQGRLVPTAHNKINFSVKGAGRILGVGNGDPSSHEPDVFVSTIPARQIKVNKWRWRLAEIPRGRDALPEYENAFDDSAWSTLDAQNSGGELTIKTPNTSAIYRAHFMVTTQDLKDAAAQIAFDGADDEGWYFLNGHFIGETHDWQAQPVFDVKKFIHAGDNVIAVGVNNVVGEGGLNPNVTVSIMSRATAPQWSRSLFNGLAQVIVQSIGEAGEFKLTASSDGLDSATIAVKTQPH
ncbi:MAG TPA: beta-galactosidase GalA [Verrucomicrobiae bacterium]|nr:beta-galactosidase GalA [Verrucomicrobiae bacterium]